jgi:hypothetical protein
VDAATAGCSAEAAGAEVGAAAGPGFSSAARTAVKEVKLRRIAA